MGAVSKARFYSVSERFSNELKSIGTMRESKAELMIRNMRFLNLEVIILDVDTIIITLIILVITVVPCGIVGSDSGIPASTRKLL